MRHESAMDGGFREAVLRGLAREDKSIPCQYLYDERGARLFEAICDLDEYYLTRTELFLLERHAEEVAELIGPGCRLVEFGSGAGRKVRLLLDALSGPGSPDSYVPVDVSRRQLFAAAQSLSETYPGLAITPVCADFLGDFILPPGRPPGRTIGFFPGSTIGNLRPGRAVDFLRQALRRIGPFGGMLVGVDLKKDPAVISAAYNDAAGVTAAFSLNLLERMNRELDGGFVVRDFEHCAHYDEREGCVRIGIVSRREQRVRIAGVFFRFGRREPIHIEDSYKYSVEEFRWLAGEAGYAAERCWVDPEGLFSLHWLRPA